MKIFFLFPAISMLATSNSPLIKFSEANQADTTAIIHFLDGNTAEWPEGKFITDKETKIRYAVDNELKRCFLR